MQRLKVKACRYLGANVVLSTSIWGTGIPTEYPKEVGGM